MLGQSTNLAFYGSHVIAVFGHNPQNVSITHIVDW
jgi:hypothetical protein